MSVARFEVKRRPSEVRTKGASDPCCMLRSDNVFPKPRRDHLAPEADLGRACGPTEVLLAAPEAALLPLLFRHLVHIYNSFSLVHRGDPLRQAVLPTARPHG